MNRHSLLQADLPRRWKRLIAPLNLIWPNTGSPGFEIHRPEGIGVGLNGYWNHVSSVWRFLRRRFEAPWWMRSTGFFLTLAAVCAMLGIAGASYAVTLICGAVAALIAEHVVEAWWLRRERQRDVANGYIRES
jgi:hypothetical protein